MTEQNIKKKSILRRTKIYISFLIFPDFISFKQQIVLSPGRTKQDVTVDRTGRLLQPANTFTTKNGRVAFTTVTSTQKQPAPVRSRRGHVFEPDETRSQG